MIDFILNKNLEDLAKQFNFSKFYTVNIIKPKNIQDLRKKINTSKDKLIIVQGNYKLNEAILKNKKVHILLDPETGVKKDSLHYKNSGLNHILCKLANKNKIAIGISFTNILKKQNKELSDLLGRIIQNINLCKKYKVKIILATFATNKYELRNKPDLLAFARLLKIPKLNNNIFKEKEFTDIKIIR